MDENQVRLIAFQWLKEKVDVLGNVLSRNLLESGFDYQGQRIPLVSPQGIFKPKQFHAIPLSITTIPNSPYNDTISTDGLLLYKYRGRDPNQPNTVLDDWKHNLETLC